MTNTEAPPPSVSPDQAQPASGQHSHADEPLLKFFEFAHLPDGLQEASKIFYELAHKIVELIPRGAERTVALRKALEGKDAAVRSATDSVKPA